MSCDKIEDEPDQGQDSDGEALWKQVTKEIKPLKGRVAGKIPKPPPQATIKESHTDFRADNRGVSPDSHFLELEAGFSGMLKPLPAVNADPSAQQIDRSTADKLRKGQIPIEARIDLHGLYQLQARQQLLSFIEQAYHRKLRCVLVVTGKGKLILEDNIRMDDQTPGVIKRHFKNWLAQEPYASMILKIQSAQIRDGGKGAYYILLRKRR